VLPTLHGRIQTRIIVLAVVGSLVTLVVTPLLPGEIPYVATFAILGTVIVLGVVWEVLYHGLQQFRWEKDWPTLFGLATMVNEGVLVWLLVVAGWVPGVDPAPSVAAFLIAFVAVWVVAWLTVNGPTRVPFIRWRFRGGRFL
jgi:hypothetical protein